MNRANEYEAAFEGYLQWHRLCYVGVDERRRTYLAGQLVKNLDFIVLGQTGARLLVDVKGRRFPAGPESKPRRVWECWSTLEDINGLQRWVDLFGGDYQALLVFLYQLSENVTVPDDTADLWTWRGRRYLLRAVALEDYRRHIRPRSTRWGTVSLPSGVFRDLVRPFHSFCEAPAIASLDTW